MKQCLKVLPIRRTAERVRHEPAPDLSNQAASRRFLEQLVHRLRDRIFAHAHRPAHLRPRRWARSRDRARVRQAWCKREAHIAPARSEQRVHGRGADRSGDAPHDRKACARFEVVELELEYVLEAPDVRRVKGDAHGARAARGHKL